jgi:phage shock protein E
MVRTVIVVLLAAASCSKSEPTSGAATASSSPAPSTTSRSQKDPATAKAWIADGAVVLDVRTPEEFAAGHLPNAVNIPVDQVASRLGEIAKLVAGDKARPIVTYCASGARSKKATLALEAAGHTRVVNGGGLDDLQ